MQNYQSKQTNSLPDIISLSGDQQGAPLQWVGMEKITVPVQLLLSSDDRATFSASVDCYVSLDASVKGIHMSRLYLLVNQHLANMEMSHQGLQFLLESMLGSHRDISQNTRVRVAFSLPLQKPSLLSDNAGYQSYDVVLDCQLSADPSKPQAMQTQLEVTVPYSSTCPCSASLARQLVAEKLSEEFDQAHISKSELVSWLTSAQNKLATPHNQRSYAYVKMAISDGKWLAIDNIIEQLEKAIGTPVQTAVKREDEQAFAKLNGDNLMFCEDAARRIKALLEKQSVVDDFWFKVEHQESLHAHNAVVIDQKF